MRIKNNSKIATIGLIAILLILISVAGVYFFNKINNEKFLIIFESNMESIISGKYDDDFKYISMNGTVVDSLSNGDISSMIMQNISYKLIEEEKEKEYAIITAEFTYPDAVAIHNEILNNNPKISEDELISEMISVIELKNFPTIRCTAEIPMIYYNETWYLLESDQFNDIITGGIYSEYVNQNEKIYNAFKETEAQKEGEEDEN